MKKLPKLTAITIGGYVFVLFLVILIVNSLFGVLSDLAIQIIGGVSLVAIFVSIGKLVFQYFKKK